jgi:antitoxin (DNA-binding transcriptional repressor) of toxin-antitoxin stability system
MKKDDVFQLNIYSIRDISTRGMNDILSSVNSDGMVFVSRYNKPVAAIIPLEAAGLKKMFVRMKQVFEENKLEDKEFLELQNTMLKLFEISEEK